LQHSKYIVSEKAGCTNEAEPDIRRACSVVCCFLGYRHLSISKTLYGIGVGNMETSVKWNLDEATEISVLSGWDVIRFEKIKHGSQWTYWVDKSIGGKIVRANRRNVMCDDLRALLEKYEAAGCGVLIAAPKKQEVLKLGTEMVAVSTKAFDWKDVRKVEIFQYGYWKHKFTFAHMHADDHPLFNKFRRDDFGGSWHESPSYWDEDEIGDYLRDSDTEKFRIFNKQGEVMQYED
jgi:hypothetical protein